MNKKKIVIRIVIALWLCLIWGHSLQPAVVSEQESGFFLDFLIKYLPAIFDNEAGMFILRKSAHFMEYFILGFLLCGEFISYLRGFIKRLSVPVFVGLFVAFIDETIQLFVVGRSGEIRDMWIDFAGVALATLIMLAISGNRRGSRRY